MGARPKGFVGGGGVSVDAGDSYQRKWGYPRGTLTAIDCPDCPAAVGEYCVSSTGKRQTTVHISRRRMAVRKYRAEHPDD